MKILILQLTYLLIPILLLGQGLPEMTYSQGKIRSKSTSSPNLPYGQPFLISGSTKLFEGQRASKVEVKIWETGRKKFSQNQKLEPLDENAKDGIIAEPVYTESTWFADLESDTNTFKLYIDKSLDFNTEYFLRFGFFVKTTLSENQKEKIIQQIRIDLKQGFQREGSANSVLIKQTIKENIDEAIDKNLNIYQEGINEGFDIDLEEKNNPFIEANIIETIVDNFGLLITAEQSLDFSKKQGDQEGVKAAQERVSKHKAAVDKGFLKARKSLSEVYTTYSINTAEANSVTELNNINIGSAFGAALVGLNFQDGNKRAYDAFGYTGLKFYLAPVDKRLSNPYLAGEDYPFKNRLSILVGLSVSGKLNYRGSELKQVLGFYPALGLGYDLNRYLTIDLGLTLFKQDSISPLKDNTLTRIGPLLGINLDIDAFNRLKALFSNNQYKLN